MILLKCNKIHSWKFPKFFVIIKRKEKNAIKFFPFRNLRFIELQKINTHNSVKIWILALFPNFRVQRSTFHILPNLLPYRIYQIDLGITLEGVGKNIPPLSLLKSIFHWLCDKVRHSPLSGQMDDSRRCFAMRRPNETVFQWQCDVRIF